MYLRDCFALKPFHDYSLCLVCILPQPAFYSQSAVCIYTQSAIFPCFVVCSLQSAVRSPQSAVRSLSFTLTEIKKAHNSPSSSLSVPRLWSLYKRPFERTANNTLPQKLENHGITSSSLCWIILRATVLLRTLYLGTGLVLSSLSQAFWLSNMWTYALTEKVSNILRTSVKFSKNPSGKKLQNCFIHKSSTGSGHLVPDLGIGGLGLAICEHHNITICVLNLNTREKLWVYHNQSS